MLVCEIVCVYLSKSLDTLNARLFVVQKYLRAVRQCYFLYHDGVSASQYLHVYTLNCGHCRNTYKGLCDYWIKAAKGSPRPHTLPKTNSVS